MSVGYVMQGHSNLDRTRLVWSKRPRCRYQSYGSRMRVEGGDVAARTGDEVVSLTYTRHSRNLSSSSVVGGAGVEAFTINDLD